MTWYPHHFFVLFVARFWYAVIYALVWSPDGTRIVSGDAHNTIQVWRAM